MTSGASQVDETTLSKEDDVTAAGHGVAVNLGLDIDGFLGMVLEPGNVDFNVKVTNVANNGILGHQREVSASDNVAVTGGGNKDVGTSSSLFHRGDFVASHRRLEGIDGVNLRDEDTSSIRAEGLGAL